MYKFIYQADNLIQSCKDIAECHFPNLNKVVLEEKTYLNVYLIYEGNFSLNFRGERPETTEVDQQSQRIRHAMDRQAVNKACLVYK